MRHAIIELLPFTSGLLLGLTPFHRLIAGRRWLIALPCLALGAALSALAGEWAPGPGDALLSLVIDSALVAGGWFTARALVALRRRI